MENTMENIEEKPAIDKFFYILNSQFTKRPMHFDRTAIEAILRMRGRLITEAEKETDSTNKELMIKEIGRIDNNIAKYKTKRIQYHMKIDPELKGYEPYKSNDEQPDKKTNVSKKAKIQNVITDEHPKAKWNDIILKFPTESSSIKGETQFGIKYKGENYKRYTFRELGLTNKNGKLRKDWIGFSALVLGDPPAITKKEMDKMKGFISRIRTFLKDFSGIKENPIHYDETHKRYNKQFRLNSPKEETFIEYHDEIKY